MLVSVVILAYGDEPWLVESVESALASQDIDVEVLIVDNGARASVEAVRGLDPRIRIISPGRNTGFAGGVNLGVSQSTGQVICMLNSDAFVDPGCIARLASRVTERDGIAGAVILLADEPDTINSAGNPLHVLGLSWAGLMGRPRAEAPPEGDLASASGACMAMTRRHWDRMGGFPEEYFAYHEDLDLCWRTRQLGLPVTVLADASCWHHYEYGRTRIKHYLLERNRLLFLLTCHEARTLAALSVPLVSLEVAMLVLSVFQGWGGQKLKGWAWLITHPKTVLRRRRAIQRDRLLPDADLTRYWVTRFTAPQEEMPAAGRLLEVVLQGYWRLARKAIEGGRAKPATTR